jgi:SAM-dependent methyltransferase
MNSGLQHVFPRLRRMLSVLRRAEPPGTSLKPARRRLRKYLKGSGIEIGALHNPMEVDSARTTVRYVDRMSLDEQRRHYPELSGYSLVRPDIIASADSLPVVADGSQDFVIANHLLEHLPDPIGAMREWYRVLRPGGTLFLALPDKRLTFDKDRPRTTLEHLIADHEDGGAGSRLGHFEEYSHLVHRKSGDELARDVEDLLNRDYSIHFHVWIPEDIAELLRYVRDAIGLRWKTLERVDRPGADEFIFVLKKPE